MRGSCVEAGLIPVRVMINLTELSILTVDAIAAAITPRTRVVIVNTPNNPTGRIYPPETLRRLAAVLEEASARNGRRIYADLGRAVQPDRLRWRPLPQPGRVLSVYLHRLLLREDAPLARPADRVHRPAADHARPGAIRAAIMQMQIVAGWAFPNAVMQYALPRLEQFTIDIDRLQRRRDRLVDALAGDGVRGRSARGDVLPLGALAQSATTRISPGN